MLSAHVQKFYDGFDVLVSGRAVPLRLLCVLVQEECKSVLEKQR